MRLDEVPTGSVYVDTNVLYMYLRSDPLHTPVIRSFLRRVVRGQVKAFVSVLALDELYYRLLLAGIKDAANPDPMRQLRDNLAGALTEHGAVIEQAVRRLITLPNTNLVGVEAADTDRMLINVRSFTLLPRDALHVAIIQRLGLGALASDDMDFDRVSSLERHWVVNPPPADAG
jgi:predicted nucleic acid-binding protein